MFVSGLFRVIHFIPVTKHTFRGCETEKKVGRCPFLFTICIFNPAISHYRPQHSRYILQYTILSHQSFCTSAISKNKSTCTHLPGIYQPTQCGNNLPALNIHFVENLLFILTVYLLYGRISIILSETLTPSSAIITKQFFFSF